jgi:hypothetical protein
MNEEWFWVFGASARIESIACKIMEARSSRKTNVMEQNANS